MIEAATALIDMPYSTMMNRSMSTLSPEVRIFVFATTTYNNGIFVSMEQFLGELGTHAMQGRTYALVENGSWSPQAGSLMEGKISAWKNMRKVGDTVTVLSSVKDDTAEALRNLARAVADDFGTSK